MIYFFSQNQYEFRNKIKIRKWITNTIKEENYIIKFINIIFCNDEYLLDINKKFLHQDYYTDIITFNYSINNLLLGELYLSTERIHDNATQFNIPFTKELYRVMIHGVLHLCQYKDNTEKEKRIMTFKENQYLDVLYSVYSII